MAYLVKDKRPHPKTGKPATRYRIADRVDGKQVTGQIGFVSEKEAKRLLTLYIERRAAGESPDDIWQRASTLDSAPTTPVVRLHDLWSRHAVQMEAHGAAASTRTSAVYAWRAWAPTFGTADAAALTQAAVDDVVVGWRRAKLSDRTVQIRVLLLKRLLELGVREGLIPSAPSLRVPPVRERRPHRWLDPAQQATLLAALPWATAPASSWAIWLCLELGLRIGEATSRRWADIDWRRAQMRVGAGAGFEVKTRRERWLPLAPSVLAQLRAAYELRPEATRETELIAPIGDCRKALEAACRRAGVPVMNPHALRHSWASRLATACVDRPTLMALGGWTSGEMLDEVYAHAHTSHVRDQVERTALSGAGVAPLHAATQPCYPELLPRPLVRGSRR